MKAAMVRHDELLEKTVAAHRGHVFARMGDGMAAAFATARDAVSAAAAFQRALAAEAWRTARPLRARVGLHTDEAVIVDDTGYASLPINRCSRLMTAAHGGQTVISGATEMLVRGQLPDGMELVDLGEHRLRDLGRPTRIFQLIRDGDRGEFPPLRTLDSFPGNLPAQVSSFIGRQDRRVTCRQSTRGVAGGDDHRRWRSRQDPLGITGRRGGAAALPGRRVAGRACSGPGHRRAWSRRSRRCSA